MTHLTGFELITRRPCLVKDTGHAGVLWGGNMMALVDEAGAIYAGKGVFVAVDPQGRKQKILPAAEGRGDGHEEPGPSA